MSYTPIKDMLSVIQPLGLPQVWRGHCGRQRAFLSRSDAQAYDAGWAAYPGPEIPDAGTPASMGYFDHEDEDLNK